MNTIYRVLRPATQQAWGVASELATGCSQSGSKGLTVLAGMLALLGVQGAYAAPPVNALPSGESVASGTATFDRSVGNQLTVNQSSSKLISNWNSFDIGSAATVNFVQPDAASMALNRVTSAAPTEIFGRLNANGQVFIVNPAGITFAAGSQVNTGSLLASSLNISDANFLNSNLTFEREGARGQINNLGTLTATEGNVVLLGPTLQNQGSIQSVQGNILLGNGDRLKVADHNLSLLQASSMISLIRNTGTLNATRVEVRKGQVILLGEQANPRSKVELRGTVNSQNFWARANQVNVNGALTSSGSTALEATQSVNISAPLDITGDGVLLSVVHGSNTGDSMLFTGAGKVNLAGAAPYVRINGNFYQVINSLAQLQAIGTNATSLAGNYVLGSDIDASSTASTPFNSLGSQQEGGFRGRFNGFGYAIHNLTIKTRSYDAGLFGFTVGGSISNARLNHVVVSGTYSVGGLVGYNLLTPITNSYVTDAAIYGKGMYAGGLVGYNDSSPITNSYATGAITGKGFYMGGLVGLNRLSPMTGSYADADLLVPVVDMVGGLLGMNISSNITNSHASGDVVAEKFAGGLIGANSGSLLSHVYATGDVKAETRFAGGLIAANHDSVVEHSYASGDVYGGDDNGALQHIGLNGGLIALNNNSAIRFSYASGNVNALGNYVGGLVGQNLGSAMIDQSYATGSATGGDYVGGLVGYNRGAISNSFATGDATASGWIYTQYGFGPKGVGAGGLVGGNGSNGTVTSSYATGTAQIEAGINASGSGGVVGLGIARVVSNSYWDLSSSQNTISRGGTGLSGSQMQQLSSFVGWDISNQLNGSSIWYIDEGNARPVLRALIP